MKTFILIVCLSIYISFIYATSDADPNIVYLCDTQSPKWGCDPKFWVGGNRLRCSNTTQLMNWATKPMRSNCYRVIAGDESAPSTSYIPGQNLNIHIRVTCLDKLYRGILLYAVDGSNTKIGNWTLPKQDPPLFRLPWTSPSNPCYGSVMHATAEWKPYHSVLYYKAPPVGTGSITFRALIKYGNANTGDFYWPNLSGDLVLTEAAVPAAPSVSWERSAIGESCTVRCGQIPGKICSETAIQTMTYNVVKTQVAPKLQCELPYVSGCGNFGGIFDPTLGVCYYTESNCTARPTRTVTCATALAGLSRNCPCVSPSTVTDNGSTGTTNGTEEEQSPANSRSPSLLTVLLVLPMLFSASPRTAFFVLLVLGIASSHNWINSLSRSPGASTYRPCKPPMTEMPHAQVGPNQEFEIEWMNGHGGDVYFVVIHSRNSDKLKFHNTSMLDDYINNAPPGNNVAMQPMRQRFHRKESPSLNNTYTPDSSGVPVTVINYFAGIVPANDSRFIYRPSSFGGRIGNIVNPTNTSVHYQMLYNVSELGNDRIVSYNNTKYPWVEAVYRFRITSFQPGRPDTARFYIPGFGGVGRYIVQYFWRGYYDCVDVDYKAAPVTSVYGLQANATIWKRIDHCLFTDVRGVYTNSEIVTDPAYCQANCVGDCYGVNVVPLAAPLSAYQFAEPVNASWYFPSVYGSDIYTPWKWGAFNNTRALFSAAADKKKFMCYAVQPKQFTDTEDEYKVTNDPDDPIFYSTCYYRFQGNIFPEYLENYTSPFLSTPWRYFTKCVDCESKTRNSDPNALPRWDITDKCINCNTEPAAVSPTPAPIQVENGTRCDGLSNTWRFGNHTTCPNTTQCVKQLFHIGRSVNVHIPMEDCRVLATRDSECSNYYFRRNVTLTSFRCYCYKSLACCKTCSRVLDTSAIQYESTSVADPTCATGVLSADNSTCCSSQCGAGNCIANGANRANTGYCCSTCATRPCSMYAPPCKM